MSDIVWITLIVAIAVAICVLSITSALADRSDTTLDVRSNIRVTQQMTCPKCNAALAFEYAQSGNEKYTSVKSIVEPGDRNVPNNN